jgi:hypothetical protein
MSKTQKGPDVFIHHSAAELDASRDLAGLLREHGLTVFFPEDSIEPGQEWRTNILDAASNAAVSVVMLSSVGVSDRMSFELTTATSRALSGSGLLIPVLLGDVSQRLLPQALHRFQGIRAKGEDWKEKVAAAVERAVMQSRPPRRQQTSHTDLPALPKNLVRTYDIDRVMRAIDTSLSDRSGPIEIVGRNGSGKTVAALAAAWTNLSRFVTTAWIDARSEVDVIRALAQLADALGQTTVGLTDTAKARLALRQLEETSTSWLLIFNDINPNWAWLDRWIPRTSSTGTSIVVSQRPGQFGGEGPTIWMTDFRKQDTERLINGQLGLSVTGEERHAVEVLSHAGQPSPLVLDFAAKYLLNQPDSNRRRLTDLLKSTLGGAANAQSALLGLMVREQLSDLERTAPVSKKIFDVLAWARQISVPLEFFTDSFEDPFFSQTQAEIEHALHQLALRGLISIDRGRAVSHSLLLETIDEPNLGTEFLTFLMRAVIRGKNSQSSVFLDASFAEQIALRVLGQALETQDTLIGRAAVQLCTEISAILSDTGEELSSERLLSRTLAVSMGVLGPDHPTTVSVQASLAGALQSTGRFEEAIVVLRESLAASMAVLGPDHPTTVSVQASLAGALQSTGRFEEAIVVLRESLAASMAVLGPDHPTTVSVQASLAGALQSTGRFEEAIDLLRRALDTSLAIFGPGHSITVAVQDNLEFVQKSHPGSHP